jgi:hypothetical protein
MAWERSNSRDAGAERCFVFQFDIRKAFDHACHCKLIEGLQSRSLHPHLLASLLTEFGRQEASITVGDIFVPACTLGRGGRQGGRDTPSLWNQRVALVLDLLVAIWASKGMVWSAPADQEGNAPRLNVLIWTDDVNLCASSFRGLRVKLAQTSEALSSYGLSIKQGSLRWSVNSTANGTRESMNVGTLTLPFAAEFDVLGVRLSPSGDTNTSPAHRVQLGWAHWFARARQLRSCRVPLHARVSRRLATVGKTVLWACGPTACE